MKSILKTYQTKLTNLSASNKSLLHLKAYKQADLDLHEFDFLLGEASIHIVEKLLLGKAAALCHVSDPRSASNNMCSKRVRQVQSRVRFIQNERGSEDLYLGYPFVEGKLKGDFLVRCPLLFIPAKIIELKNQWQVVPNTEAPIKFNRSFLLAYAHYEQVKLDKSLEELQVEDLDYDDLRTLLIKLYEVLKSSSIELNFNSELFENHLRFFHTCKKSDFEDEYKEGILKLQPYAVLGIYPQSGSNLHADYESIIESCAHESLEAFFATKTAEGLQEKEERFYEPFPIDASQEEALKMLREGKSIVVQGPPGTGKSQLIAQVIADYLANGKKVLLACDKRVALDVVYERLRTIGLDNYVGLVHDYNIDRKQLYDKISKHIENLEQAQLQTNSYNTIALEREFLQVSRRIVQIGQELEAFKEALFDDQKFGVSVKYLYLNTSPSSGRLSSDTLSHAEALTFTNAAASLNHNTLSQLHNKLKYWLPKAALFERDGFIFKHRRSYALLKSTDARLIYEMHVLKDQHIEEVKHTTLQAFHVPLSLLEFEALQPYKDPIAELSHLLKSAIEFSIFKNYSNKKLQQERLAAFYEKARQLFLGGTVHTFEL
ncbi:MAG TPA: AAA domain-containing protein, partial [Cytophagales bacterium]|nr:AAA domain-containing protein [Cytophagales bacterium]